MLYERYADKKPIMLFDVQEQRIYAMPYAEYRADLSKRSQASLKKQYECAIANGEIAICEICKRQPSGKAHVL